MDEVKTKPVKVYSYIRVSTSMQVDKYSVDAQRNSIQKHIDYKDMVLVHEYKDLGISGKNIEDRTEFKQMLKDIANKKDDVKFLNQRVGLGNLVIGCQFFSFVIC